MCTNSRKADVAFCLLQIVCICIVASVPRFTVKHILLDYFLWISCLHHVRYVSGKRIRPMGYEMENQ